MPRALVVFFFNPGGGVMKRLYTFSLSTLFMYTFLYPAEHQSIERRVSLPDVFKRRGSFLGNFFSHNSVIEASEPKPLMRRRTKSAEHGLVPSKLAGVSPMSLSVPSLTAPRIKLDPQEVNRLLTEGKHYINLANNARDKGTREQFLRLAEIPFEILYRAGNPEGVELLLTKIWTRDFGKRTSIQMHAMENSLKECCPNNPELLVLYGRLREMVLKERIKSYQQKRLTQGLLSLVHIKLVDDCENARQFVAAIDELSKRASIIDDEDLDLTGAG